MPFICIHASDVNWQQKFNPYLATLLAHQYNISIFTMIRPDPVLVTIDNINRYLCCSEEHTEDNDTIGINRSSILT